MTDHKTKRKVMLTTARNSFPVGTKVQVDFRPLGYEVGEVIKHKIGENRETLNGTSFWRGDKPMVQVDFPKLGKKMWLNLNELKLV